LVLVQRDLDHHLICLGGGKRDREKRKNKHALTTADGVRRWRLLSYLDVDS
jgi:hypothetical protein